MRLIEIPDDGIVRQDIMCGDTTVGYRCLDLSDLPTIDPESLAEYLRRLGYEVKKCQH